MAWSKFEIKHIAIVYIIVSMIVYSGLKKNRYLNSEHRDISQSFLGYKTFDLDVNTLEMWNLFIFFLPTSITGSFYDGI